MSDHSDKTKVSPVAAGIAGAVAGAALGAIAAKTLSEEKNRKLIKKKMGEFKTWSERTMKEIRDRGEEVQETADEIADDLRTEAKELKEKTEKGEHQQLN